MKNRFTRKSRSGRGRIRREIKDGVFERDDFTCVFCGSQRARGELTIDHLIPLSGGGLDEVINYVTACRGCNERKASIPLEDFARGLPLSVESLPVHGDPVIDNEALPLAIRRIRKRVLDRMRSGEIAIVGTSAQKKIEKTYRRALWQTPVGIDLELQFPTLPGHVRAMIPEIKTIANSPQEYLLLVELAKSANTRNLIGSVLTPGCDVVRRSRDIGSKSGDKALVKRITQAFVRYERECRRQGLPPSLPNGAA